MFYKPVKQRPYTFKYVQDKYFIEKMYYGLIKRNPALLIYVPDRYKTQEMCNK